MGAISTTAPSVKSIQRGQFTFAASTSYASGQAVTIAAVDTNKAVAEIVRDARTTDNEVASVIMTNATTITLYRVTNSTAASQVVYWQVTEFY